MGGLLCAEPIADAENEIPAFVLKSIRIPPTKGNRLAVG